VVQRVSDRVGRGLTLALALAAEDCATVNLETWKKALQAHPEFSPRYEAGRGKFLDYALTQLAASPDLANLRWLLKHRFPDLFPRDPDLALTLHTNTSVVIPDELLQRARRIAAEECKVQSPAAFVRSTTAARESKVKTIRVTDG
jgi:hypothetical protein